MGITFIITGLMAMAFMGLLGINLAVPKKEKEPGPQDIPFKRAENPVA